MRVIGKMVSHIHTLIISVEEGGGDVKMKEKEIDHQML